MAKVLFEHDTAQESPAVGLLLVPGVNEVTAEQAEVLLACGLCKPVDEAPAERPRKVTRKQNESEESDGAR